MAKTESMSSEPPDDVEAARRLIPGFKEDAALLMVNWPEAPGELPFSGRYWAEPDDKEYFCVVRGLDSTDPEDWSCPSIWKIATGGVRFDLESVGTKIEFHPPGSQPDSFVTTVGKTAQVQHVLDRFVQLEPQWFLAWYSVRDL